MMATEFTSNFKNVHACGAKVKRTGLPCQQPAMANGRCKLHGGKSTGPRTPEGRASISENNKKHGNYTNQANSIRKQISQKNKAMRQCGESLDAALSCNPNAEELTASDSQGSLSHLLHLAIEESDQAAFLELAKYFLLCELTLKPATSIAQELQISLDEAYRMIDIFSVVNRREFKNTDIHNYYEQAVRISADTMRWANSVMFDDTQPMDVRLKAGKLANQSSTTLMQAMEKSGARNRVLEQAEFYELKRGILGMWLSAQANLSEKYPDNKEIPKRHELIDSYVQRYGTDFGHGTPIDDLARLQQLFSVTT